MKNIQIIDIEKALDEKKAMQKNFIREESLQGEQGFSWCADVRGIEDLQERPDIPQPLFRGGRDGLPAWMDRIKCCGNAVVPQVAQFIARRIKEIEGAYKEK